MDWRTYFEQRKVSADEAVSHINSGDRVVIGHACGEPSYLVDTMVAHAEDYENVEIVHMLQGQVRVLQARYGEAFSPPCVLCRR